MASCNLLTSSPSFKADFGLSDLGFCIVSKFGLVACVCFVFGMPEQISRCPEKRKSVASIRKLFISVSGS